MKKVNRTTRLILLSALLAIIGRAAPLHAQTLLLAVDFQNAANNAALPVSQVGFQPFERSETSSFASVSAQFGSYTVTLSNVIFYNRGRISNSGGFTYAGVYQDNIYRVNSTGGIDVVIGGLAATTAYDVRLYSYDWIAPSGFAIGDWVTMAYTGTNGTVGSGSVAYQFGETSNSRTPSVGVPTSNHHYSTLVRFTTNADGEIAFNVYSGTTKGSAVYNRAYLNGFELIHVDARVIPEPSVLPLLLGSGLGLCLWRRMRRRG